METTTRRVDNNLGGGRTMAQFSTKDGAVGTVENLQAIARNFDITAPTQTGDQKKDAQSRSKFFNDLKKAKAEGSLSLSLDKGELQTRLFKNP